ncbi:unnamed protein product [Sphagnum troendelagicum]
MMGHVVPSCCSSFELQFSRVEDKKMASGLAMGLFVRRRRSCVLQMQRMWVQERKLERRRILCHVRALKDQQQLEGSEAVQEGKKKSGKSSKLLGSSQAEDGSRGNNKHGLSRRALVALIALSAQGFAVSPSTRLVSAKLINAGASQEPAVKQKLGSLMQVAAEGDQAEVDFGAGGILNPVGVVGGGVLGILYWLERQAKASSTSALKEANLKLKQTNATMESLREKLEGDLLAERAQAQEQADKAQKEQISLSEELRKAKLSAKEQQEKLESEKILVSELQQRIGDLQTELSETDVKYKSLMESFEEEQKQTEGLEDKLQVLDLQIKEKEKQIVDLSSTVQNMEVISGTHLSQLNATKATLSRVETMAAKLDQELTSVQKTLTDKQNTVKDLNKELAAATAGQKQAMSEIADLQRELNSLQVLLTEEQEKEAILTKDLKETAHGLKEASSEAKSLQQRLLETCAIKDKLEKQLLQTTKELNNNLGAVNHSLAAKEEEVQALKQSLREEGANAARLTDELSKVALMLKDAERKAASGAEELTASKSAQKGLERELKQMAQALEAALQDASCSAEQLTAAIDVSQKLETLLADARAATVTINAELAEERKANAAAKKQLTVSKKALATEKANVNTLHENLSQTQETLENLNQHTLSLSKELNAAKHKIASLESEMASLLHSLDEERNKSAALQLGTSQMDAIMKEKELACGKVEQLEKELVNTRAESKILKKNPTERRRIVKNGQIQRSERTHSGDLSHTKQRVDDEKSARR